MRIGSGAGFSADRLDPAVDLARRGNLDFLVFECLGERTLAFGHRDRRLNPDKGYNAYFAQRLRAVLEPCLASGTRIVTNMGVANPRAAAHLAADIFRELGIRNRRIAYVTGDDVTALVGPDTDLPEIGRTVGEVGHEMVGANAYLGADALLPALRTGADVIITGRVADPSLFLAPILDRFGWALDDWRHLGAGTLVGHLLECAAQVTGGYFADPGKKDVPDLAYVGFPIAVVEESGDAVVTKLPGTGGCVTVETVREQQLYEVHDPAAYLTPDVVADFSRVVTTQIGPDQVRVAGARGNGRPQTLKATVSFDGGFLAEAGISYAGPNAQARARLAADILQERMSNVHGWSQPLRTDLIGVSSLHGTARNYGGTSQDIRVRAALRTTSLPMAEALLWETESLLVCGPAGGGGYRGTITPSVVTHSAFIDRKLVSPDMDVIEP